MSDRPDAATKSVGDFEGHGEEEYANAVAFTAESGKAFVFPMNDMEIQSSNGTLNYRLQVVKASFTAFKERPFGVKTVYASISGQIQVVTPLFANLAVFIREITIGGRQFRLGPGGQGCAVVPTSQNRVGYSEIFVGEIGDLLHDAIVDGTGFGFRRAYLYRTGANAIPITLPPLQS